MSLAIVIPTYNESENIVDLIQQVLLFSNAHIIIVDDSSPDGTGALVLGLHNDRITLLERKEKLGLGSAYRAGFDFALKQGYTIIGQMDADFLTNQRVFKNWQISQIRTHLSSVHVI